MSKPNPLQGFFRKPKFSMTLPSRGNWYAKGSLDSTDGTGAADNVIPYTETPALEAWLRAGGNTEVRSLLTPLISHADVQAAPRAVDVWRLVRFWAATLRVASD